MEFRPWAWVYFSSFVVVAVFVVVNLSIAVVIDNLETVKGELEAHPADDPAAAVRAQLAELRQRLDAFEAALDGERCG